MRVENNTIYLTNRDKEGLNFKAISKEDRDRLIDGVKKNTLKRAGFYGITSGALTVFATVFGRLNLYRFSDVISVGLCLMAALFLYMCNRVLTDEDVILDALEHPEDRMLCTVSVEDRFWDYSSSQYVWNVKDGDYRTRLYIADHAVSEGTRLAFVVQKDPMEDCKNRRNTMETKDIDEMIAFCERERKQTQNTTAIWMDGAPNPNVLMMEKIIEALKELKNYREQ